MCRVLILIERVGNVLHKLYSEHNYECEIYRILRFSSILSVDNKLLLFSDSVDLSIISFLKIETVFICQN